MTTQTIPRYLKDPVRACIAHRMHADGRPIESIADVTGWTNDEIREHQAVVIRDQAAVPTPGVPRDWQTPPDTIEQDEAMAANLAALRSFDLAGLRAGTVKQIRSAIVDAGATFVYLHESTRAEILAKAGECLTDGQLGRAAAHVKAARDDKWVTAPLAEPDELTISEMDAFDLREIYFPHGTPDSNGYACAVVDESTLTLMGYTGRVTQGVALGSGRVAELHRTGGRWVSSAWETADTMPERNAIDLKADVDLMLQWLRGNS